MPNIRLPGGNGKRSKITVMCQCDPSFRNGQSQQDDIIRTNQCVFFDIAHIETKRSEKRDDLRVNILICQ